MTSNRRGEESPLFGTELTAKPKGLCAGHPGSVRQLIEDMDTPEQGLCVVCYMFTGEVSPPDPKR